MPFFLLEMTRVWTLGQWHRVSNIKVFCFQVIAFTMVLCSLADIVQPVVHHGINKPEDSCGNLVSQSVYLSLSFFLFFL